MPTFEVRVQGGKRWIRQGVNVGAAVKKALDELYPQEVPDTLTLTVIRHEGGAVIIDPPEEP